MDTHPNPLSDTDQRLTELEIKASYSEDLLEQLNMTIYRQQLQIDALLHELQQLRQQGLELPVLILTARDSVTDRVDGLQAGADDYLLKPFDLRELAARLHTLLRRVAGRSVNLIEHGSLTYDPSSRVTLLGGQPVDLSRREQALLQALLHNRGRVLSSDNSRTASTVLATSWKATP